MIDHPYPECKRCGFPSRPPTLAVYRNQLHWLCQECHQELKEARAIWKARRKAKAQ